MKKLLILLLLCMIGCRAEYNLTNLRLIYSYMPENQLIELKSKLTDSINLKCINFELKKRKK